MKTVLMMFVVALAMSACTKPESAARQLEAAGYTDIQLQGYDWFNCSKDDAFHDKFTAKGPTGKPVSGVVCNGLLFKGGTIRLD